MNQNIVSAPRLYSPISDIEPLLWGKDEMSLPRGNITSHPNVTFEFECLALLQHELRIYDIGEVLTLDFSRTFSDVTYSVIVIGRRWSEADTRALYSTWNPVLGYIDAYGHQLETCTYDQAGPLMDWLNSRNLMAG